jgi:hypothetical protein
MQWSRSKSRSPGRSDAVQDPILGKLFWTRVGCSRFSAIEPNEPNKPEKPNKPDGREKPTQFFRSLLVCGPVGERTKYIFFVLLPARRGLREVAICPQQLR